MPSHDAIFQQWFLALLSLPVNAAATLPLIVCLGLVAGRRGNGAFCLAGNTRLLNFAFILSLFGAPWQFLNYLLQILPLLNPVPDHALNHALNHGPNWWAPLFSAAGRSHFLCIALWIAGPVFLYLGCRKLANTRLTRPDDRYPLSFARQPIIFCLCAAGCFFLAFWLANWPFAGLPPEMQWDRAIMAIGRHAMRHYFMAFCPAGALALVLLLKKPFVSTRENRLAARWLSAWAAAGYFPQTLISLGLILGLALRGNLMPNLASGVLAQSLASGCMACAIACWLTLLIGKKNRPVLIYAGLGFLLLHISAPFLVKLGNQQF